MADEYSPERTRVVEAIYDLVDAISSGRVVRGRGGFSISGTGFRDPLRDLGDALDAYVDARVVAALEARDPASQGNE